MITWFFIRTYDYILDAIDDTKPKVHLIKNTSTKVISNNRWSKKSWSLPWKNIAYLGNHNDKFIKKKGEEKPKNKDLKRNLKLYIQNYEAHFVLIKVFEGVTSVLGAYEHILTIQKIEKAKFS